MALLAPGGSQLHFSLRINNCYEQIEAFSIHLILCLELNSSIAIVEATMAMDELSWRWWSNNRFMQ